MKYRNLGTRKVTNSLATHYPGNATFPTHSLQTVKRWQGRSFRWWHQFNSITNCTFARQKPSTIASFINVRGWSRAHLTSRSRSDKRSNQSKVCLSPLILSSDWTRLTLASVTSYVSVEAVTIRFGYRQHDDHGEIMVGLTPLQLRFENVYLTVLETRNTGPKH